LTAEIEAESKLLEEEKAILEAINAGLSVTQGSDPHKLHPFSHGGDPKPSRAQPADSETHHAKKTSALHLSDLGHDPQAEQILANLRRHINGMQNSVDSATSLQSSLSTTQAALDTFNWSHLGEIEYQRVYGLARHMTHQASAEGKF
jgi:hypothetical protein